MSAVDPSVLNEMLTPRARMLVANLNPDGAVYSAASEWLAAHYGEALACECGVYITYTAVSAALLSATIGMTMADAVACVQSRGAESARSDGGCFSA